MQGEIRTHLLGMQRLFCRALSPVLRFQLMTAKTNSKILAYRWRILSWLLSEHGDRLLPDDSPVGVTPRIKNPLPEGRRVPLETAVEHITEGFNIAAAVEIAASLEGADETVAVSQSGKPLSGGQAAAVQKRMGLNKNPAEDCDAFWHPARRWPWYRERTQQLAEAYSEIAELVEEQQLTRLPDRKLTAVLAARAAAETPAAATRSAERRAKKQKQHSRLVTITEDDLDLADGSRVVSAVVRSDAGSVREWETARVEQRWLGASVAASCLGTGIGYETPEKIYEQMQQGAATVKHTNAMIAGTVRQEEIVESAVAALRDEGWEAERLLPAFTEVTVAAGDEWDVATLDCVLRLKRVTEDGEIQQETVVLETKAPDSITFHEAWKIPVADSNDRRKSEIVVPPAVAAQVQDQLRACGYQRGIAAALMPYWEEARDDGLPSVALVWIEADGVFQQQLAEAKQAMRRCLETGTPPSMDKRYYASLHKQDVGFPDWSRKTSPGSATVQLDDDTVEPFRRLLAAKNQAKQLKIEENAARAEVDSILAAGAEAEHDGTKVAAYAGRLGVDQTAFLADERTRKYYLPGGEGDDTKIDWPRTLSNNPAVLADVIGTAKPRPSLRFDKNFRTQNENATPEPAEAVAVHFDDLIADTPKIVRASDGDGNQATVVAASSIEELEKMLAEMPDEPEG